MGNKLGGTVSAQRLHRLHLQVGALGVSSAACSAHRWWGVGVAEAALAHTAE